MSRPTFAHRFLIDDLSDEPELSFVSPDQFSLLYGEDEPETDCWADRTIGVEVSDIVSEESISLQRERRASQLAPRTTRPERHVLGKMALAQMPFFVPAPLQASPASTAEAPRGEEEAFGFGTALLIVAMIASAVLLTLQVDAQELLRAILGGAVPTL